MSSLRDLIRPGQVMKRQRRHADTLRDAKKYTEAAAAYRFYLTECASDAPIWVQYAHMLKESGHARDAEQAYLRALEIEPDVADTHLNLAHLRYRQGNVTGGIQSIERSYELERDPAVAETIAEWRKNPLAAAPPLEPPPPTPLLTPLAPALRRDRNVGSIDYVGGTAVSGWAVNPDAPGTPAIIEFRTGDKVIGAVSNGLFRADVAMAGVGTTTAGFMAALDLDPRNRNLFTVHAYLRNSGEELDNSPFETTGYSPLPKIGEHQGIGNARIATAKVIRLTPGRDVALFVTHAPDGTLKPHIPPYLAALRDNDIETILIVVAERSTRIAATDLDLVAGAYVRENVGYDFAAWAHALLLNRDAYAAPILYLVNDSMFGPNDPAVFRSIVERVRASEADLVGLTESHESGWHIQSYFLALKQRALANLNVQRFFNTMVNLPGKQAVIDMYEIKLASLVEMNGMRAEALFRSFDPRNATMFAWRELICDGFPFVKTLLFREQSPLFDIENWELFLKAHGFDVTMLKGSLKHQKVTGPVEPGFPLLAMPAPDFQRGRLKVAFYGPWNYDNGLGFGSRGLIAALRRLDVDLNLHPIKKPFHIHRPLAPPFDIRDFEGPADIAIVNLNPDSWFLLTDEQRRDVDGARKRIGHWVWEMAHIPAAWHTDFSSVDRIWAPSGYCNDVFATEASVEVDTVPYAVPLEGEHASIDRTAVLETFGIAPERRIILYVFDGSSYLVRKNPHALVRAFAASGLAAKGWTLVLKTKHLMDRPADGKAFKMLVDKTRDVLLIDRSLPQNDLNELFAAADIYTSTHCSEGFGLTIAEAMGAGKTVVATDFGGSTEFLDASCGYPVRAEPFTLEEDFGHYTSQGRWAKIDEAALTDALLRATTAIDDGDHAIGEAARQRIRDVLSIDAIADRMRSSLETLFDPVLPRGRDRPALNSHLLDGVAVNHTVVTDGLTVLPLAAGTLTPLAAVRDIVKGETRDWLMLVPEDAIINPYIRSTFMAYAASRPDVAIFYADDFATKGALLGDQLRLKPEFDFTLFLAQDYIGAPLFVRASAYRQLGGVDVALGDVGLTDLLMRARAAGMSIARVPSVMVAFRGARPSPDPVRRRRLLAAHPTLRGFDLEEGLVLGTARLARRFDTATIPAVTLVVPTRRARHADGGSYVERFLDSLDQTDWPLDRLRVLIGDDLADDPSYLSRRRPFAVDRIVTSRSAGEPFNYAAKMNQLWRAAKTEHIVLMNDDVRVTHGGWLKALMTFAISEDVGLAGPLLRYENGSIQHAGLAGGLHGLVAHNWLGRLTDRGTYQEWALVHREWSMITGAVMATRRTALDRVDGFDERLKLEFNDIDLCLRLRASGLRIVYTPYADMVHAEKASRAKTVPPAEDLALFQTRWRHWLSDDPAFHPRMNRYRFDIEPGFEEGDWFVQ